VAVALACVGGAMFVGAPGLSDTDTVILRVCTNIAALAAVVGALLMHRRDRYAGRRVSELKVRQSSMEWRAEERQAELEGELDDVREERDRLERTLGDKRSELTRLRNEYAGLLRRFAHSETELASVVEGARRLQLEAGAPVRALASGASDHRQHSGAPTPLTYLQAHEALKRFARNSARQLQYERKERERAEALRRREEEQERERRGWRQSQEQAAADRRGVPEQPRGEPGTGRFDFFGGGGNKRRRRATQQRRPPGSTEQAPTNDAESVSGAASGEGPAGSGPGGSAPNSANSAANSAVNSTKSGSGSGSGAEAGEGAAADSAVRSAE
jgi:hypothetical protein